MASEDDLSSTEYGCRESNRVSVNTLLAGPDRPTYPDSINHPTHRLCITWRIGAPMGQCQALDSAGRLGNSHGPDNPKRFLRADFAVTAQTGNLSLKRMRNAADGRRTDACRCAGGQLQCPRQAAKERRVSHRGPVRASRPANTESGKRQDSRVFAATQGNTSCV